MNSKLSSTITRLNQNSLNSDSLSINELLTLNDEELGKLDIAYTNLICASGLPGTENLEINQYLKTLDHAAEQVEYNTQRCLWFKQRPEEYDYSFNLFRIHVLYSILRRDFGFFYNLACRSEDTTPRPIDTFIHGLFQGSGGNCVSMPVMLTAVGRRLNYPLKLVKAKNHYFVRWDEDGGERFNLEVSLQEGFNCHPDDYYRQFRFPMTPKQEVEGSFLVSMTPRQELAAFLNERGYCWLSMKKYQQAVESFLRAKITEPPNVYYGTWHYLALKEWGEHLQASLPPNFPEVALVFPPKRRYPSHIVPHEIEKKMISLQTIEEVWQRPQHQAWWESLRQFPDSRPSNVPRRITIQLAQ